MKRYNVAPLGVNATLTPTQRAHAQRAVSLLANTAGALEQAGPALVPALNAVMGLELAVARMIDRTPTPGTRELTEHAA